MPQAAIPYIVAAAAVVGAAASVMSARKQRKSAAAALEEQKKQNELNNRFESVRRQRQIRQAIAQQRVQTAQLEQAGVTQGVVGSSIVAGAVGATRTDMATSVGAANAQAGAQYGISQSQMRESQHRLNATTANNWTNVATIAGGVAQAVGAFYGGGGFSSGAASAASSSQSYGASNQPSYGFSF